MENLELTPIKKGSDKILVDTLLKKLSMNIDEFNFYLKEIYPEMKKLKAIDLFSIEKANEIIKQFVEIEFNLEKWKSNSNIDDFQNLISFIDEVLKKIELQTKIHKETLKNSNSSYKKLQQLQTRNIEIENLKNYLSSKFDFSLENLKDKLIFMKSEAMEFLEEVDNSFSIFNDEKLSQTQINFAFTATKIRRLYKEQIKKISNFANVDQFFTKLLEAIIILKESDDKFQMMNKEKLSKILENDYLEEHFERLFNEWQNEVDKINKFYFVIVKAYFSGKISENVVLELFKILENIKRELEEFYLNIRSGLVIKYKNNPKNELLEKTATKERLFKIYQNSQAQFLKLLNETSKSESKFINEILNELLQFNFDETMVNYGDIYEKMVKLHSKNLEIYLDDIEEYGKELEKKDMAIEKLIFKMKKDLEKEGE